MSKIRPFLWFDGRSQEAMHFYASVFKNSTIVRESAHSVAFELEGQAFLALDGGPMYAFTPAISFFVDCANQDEVDYYWERLCDGGEPGRCGWLVDKFGVSWQIVPTILGELLGDDDEAVAERVWETMMTMNKIDIAALERARSITP